MMLKKSRTKKHYDKHAKEFVVVSVYNNCRILHKKNGCSRSKHFTEYYDFDTLKKVNESNIAQTYCHNCFSENPLSKIEPNSIIKNKPSKFFKSTFSLCAAILGFIALESGIVGKIFGSIIMFVSGWGIAWFLEIFTEKINNKTIRIIIEILLCLLLGIFAVTREYGHYQPPYSNSKNENSIGNGWDEYDYDDDGDINQNEWEDALGDYMDKVMD